MELTITIPENIRANLDSELAIEGSNGKVTRLFNHPRVKMNMGSGTITIKTESELKSDKAVAHAWKSHVENMFEGAVKDYEYKLKILYTHFPVTLKEDKGIITITNYMGEKGKRTAKVLEGVKVKIGKDEITVTGADKEKVGQTAANLEKSCQQKTKDIRIYQDGIYITQKG